MKLKSYLLGLLCSCLASGCHHAAPNAGFIQHTELLYEDKNAPFDAIWRKDGVDLRHYKKILIKDVDVTHLLKMSWWDKLSFANSSRELSPENEVKILAQYFKDSLIRSFSHQQNLDYQIVSEPDTNTIEIELSIVEVVPTKVWLNSLSYLIAGALDTGATAIEGRMRDAVSHEVLYRFKDKRAGPFSIINVGDLTWYSHSKDTINVWANLITKVCSSEPNSKIEAPIGFTLVPW